MPDASKQHATWYEYWIREEQAIGETERTISVAGTAKVSGDVAKTATQALLNSVPPVPPADSDDLTPANKRQRRQPKPVKELTEEEKMKQEALKQEEKMRQDVQKQEAIVKKNCQTDLEESQKLCMDAQNKFEIQLSLLDALVETIRNKEGFGEGPANYLNEKVQEQKDKVKALETEWATSHKKKAEILQTESIAELKNLVESEVSALDAAREKVSEGYKNFQTNVVSNFSSVAAASKKRQNA